MKEINVVFNYFNIYVNYRHIALLAETITAQGKLMAISRNGINRVYTSPFRKCSFEETVDILIKAAVYSVKEPLKGVTENIMMG
jgi:DNA-directed RNA polymerase II subunit RPB1